VPFLCIHGAEDKVALPKSSDYIYSNAGTDIEDRQLYVIPGAKHEPFHETAAIRTGAIQYVVDYFETQYRRTGQVVNPKGKQLVQASASENESDEVTLGATEVTTDSAEKSVELTTIPSSVKVASPAAPAVAPAVVEGAVSSETDAPVTAVAEAESEPLKEVISAEDVGVAV